MPGMAAMRAGTKTEGLRNQSSPQRQVLPTHGSCNRQSPAGPSAPPQLEACSKCGAGLPIDFEARTTRAKIVLGRSALPDLVGIAWEGRTLKSPMPQVVLTLDS